MKTLMVYSESGGVSKTTTSVSIAMIAATQGMDVVLIDLDPRAAATKWIGVEPAEAGLHVGAILDDEDPFGWAEELAVQSTWNSRLRVIPSGRGVSNREAERPDHSELRLKRSLEGLTADVVVIDCPNRQGGPLTLAALNAADRVVYAAKASNDGIDGVDGARRTVHQFQVHRERLGAPNTLQESGIVVGDVKETVMSRAAKASLAELAASGLCLDPIIPSRSIVDEVRMNGEWYGNYGKGRPVLTAYTTITGKVLA